MITKKGSAETDGMWTGLLVLVVGIAIGFLVESSGVFDSAAEAGALAPSQKVTQLRAFLQPTSNAKEDVPDVPGNGLETLHVELSTKAARRLQDVRDRAMRRGIIIQDDDDTVSATITMGGAPIKAKVRIKGDWTDHVETDQWSLRVQLKSGKLLGMSVFSIQHPKTRGWLWEWFVLAAARRQGLLAPRGTFVNVEINGNGMGIYYLEEHFSKELLESQGRREGPIVLWDESTNWSALLQQKILSTRGIELTSAITFGESRSVSSAPVRAYKESRLQGSDSLSRSLFGAVKQMRELQAIAVASSSSSSRLRALEAATAVQGKSIDSIMAVGKLAQFGALAILFQLEHPLIWHNMRFYHDPVLDRLEPIVFDTNADHPGPRDLFFSGLGGVSRQFQKSSAYYDGVFRELGELCRPEYLDGLMRDLGPELATYEKALEKFAQVPGSCTSAAILQRLRTQQEFARMILYPADPLNVAATYQLDEGGDIKRADGEVCVDCWATTRTPVVVEGFEFSNGRFQSAQASLTTEGALAHTDGTQGVVLPSDGRHVRFRFRLDERLASLENVKSSIAAVRDPSAGTASLALDIGLRFRPIAATVTQVENLRFRRVKPEWEPEGGRPDAPTLSAALEQHPFLWFRPELGELHVRAGTWDVEGDLIVPSGHTLHAKHPVLLRFDEDAVLMTDSPLIWRNVTLEPKAGLKRWRGVAVLNATGRSEWDKVVVRNTDALARAGWVLTGGITFYHSPVTMRDCMIDGTLAEDGTNVFGTDFLLERVTFRGCVSDSFDGDIVTGTVRDCLFTEGLADGVDFSGSDVIVENCRFINLADKGISAGEDSKVRVIGGICDGVALGIASKDRSEVIADGLVIRNASKYALAGFIKKLEFGASSMVVSNMTIEGSGIGDMLVQTGCTLTVDGVAQPTQDLDVKQLYEDKILGQ